MDVFTYTPGGRETLEAFNLRIKEYTSKYDVVGVVSGVLGKTLVMSLTLASDGIASPVVVQPIVFVIPPAYEPVLEDTLTKVVNDIKALDNPEKEVTSLPLEMRTHATPGDPDQLGYAIAIVAVGELDSDE